MTFQQELSSWLSLSKLNTSPIPEIGDKAPSSDKLPMPNTNGKPTILTFLRHCGCPSVAEKTFRNLLALASTNPSVNFLAISHSSPEATQNWLSSLDFTPSNAPENFHLIVDSTREAYAQWGLGASSLWHVLNPWALYSVYALGKGEGIWNRPTESGSRWQTSGCWAVDGEGVVQWGGVAKAADDICLPPSSQGLLPWQNAI